MSKVAWCIHSYIILTKWQADACTNISPAMNFRTTSPTALQMEVTRRDGRTCCIDPRSPTFRNENDVLYACVICNLSFVFVCAPVFVPIILCRSIKSGASSRLRIAFYCMCRVTSFTYSTYLFTYLFTYTWQEATATASSGRARRVSFSDWWCIIGDW